MIVFIIRLLNIMLAALLAGVSFGIWIGFNPMLLSASAYVEQQQNMLVSLRVLMVSLVVIATIVTVLSAFLQKRERAAFISLLMAAVLFFTCILITRFGNKPIDDQVLTWTTSSLPGDWTELRDQWWSYHKMRTIAELGAFIIVVWNGIAKTL